MPLEPLVDHRMSQQFGFFAVTVYHFSGAFNVLRMNRYDPLIPFDPGADRISYSPVFHSDMIALHWNGAMLRIGGALITLEVGLLKYFGIDSHVRRLRQSISRHAPQLMTPMPYQWLPPDAR